MALNTPLLLITPKVFDTVVIEKEVVCFLLLLKIVFISIYDVNYVFTFQKINTFVGNKAKVSISK